MNLLVAILVRGPVSTRPARPAARCLACYGRAVVDQEGPAVQPGQSSPLVDDWVGAYWAEFSRLYLRSPREQLGFQDLLTLSGTRTTGRQQRLSDDTPAVPTPLWIALVFGGCVAVALQLGMADPRERLRVHALLLAGLAGVVAAITNLEPGL